MLEKGKVYCTLVLLLQERRISLNQLAKDTGVAYTTLHRLATNKLERVDLHALGKVCECLGVVPGDILRISGQDHLQSTISPEGLAAIMVNAGIGSVDLSVTEFEQSREQRLALLREKLQERINEYIELESKMIMNYHQEQSNKTKNFLVNLAGMILPPEKHQEFLEKQELVSNLSPEEFNKRVEYGKKLLPANKTISEAMMAIMNSSEAIRLILFLANTIKEKGKDFDLTELKETVDFFFRHGLADSEPV